MENKNITVAINGFGRIGRTILRQLMSTRSASGIDVVLINDVAPLESCAYLFEFDSVFGVFPGTVSEAEGALVVNGLPIKFTQTDDISTLDLSGVDVVLECTGHANTVSVAERGLAAGAQRVLISGPSTAAEVTVVLGANEAELAGQKIVSNGSCTTNALAPLLRVLDAEFGIVAAHMTTVHCYTSSQPMTDAPRGNPARSRAGALSMVPTTTSATALVGQVLPHLGGKISGAAIRVPVASVSAVDLTATLEKATDIAELTAFLRGLEGALIGVTEKPLVSTDLRTRPESLVLALPETLMTDAHHVRIFGWYDNEWGFSNRMLDMVLAISTGR